MMNVTVTVIASMRGFPMAHLSVSEVARRICAKPKDISDLFYRRELRDDLCPIVGGRRIIPETYIDMITAALKRNGRPVGKGVGNG